MPPAVYVFVGLALVDVVPSPKSQEYDVALVDVLVKLTLHGAVQPPPLKVKLVIEIGQIAVLKLISSL